MIFDNPTDLSLDSASEPPMQNVSAQRHPGISQLGVGERVRLVRPRWDTRIAVVSFTFPALDQVSVSPPLENRAIWSVSDLTAVKV